MVPARFWGLNWRWSIISTLLIIAADVIMVLTATWLTSLPSLHSFWSRLK